MAHRKRANDPRPGRSEAWDKFLRESGHTRLIVPEASIEPIVGKTGWTPEDEMSGPGPCPKHPGSISPGSRLYCPKCAQSGHEVKLAAQRSLKPAPALDRKPWTPKPKSTGKRGRPRTRTRAA